MTDAERFERIENITAAIAEDRRKDRDEYKALWRDTQRQIDANARAIAQITAATAENARELSELRLLIRDLAEDTNHRIQALVSAIGALAQQRRE